jgi:hypothetical protein
LAREARPFLEDGSQFGISRTAFRRMRKAEKRELMLGWFHANFEDPAERTPFISAEGGYQWIWGGPYEARDELYSMFGDLVNEALIEEVVEEVERDGLTDWAPVSSPDDYDDEVPPDEPPSLDAFLDEPSPQYGTGADFEARARVRTALDRLQQSLDRPRTIGIGHNQPPEEPDEIKELRPAVAELRAEFAKPNPAIPNVKHWAKKLRDAVIASAKWGAKMVIGGALSALGGAAALDVWQYYDPTLHHAFNSIIQWLHISAIIPS